MDHNRLLWKITWEQIGNSEEWMNTKKDTTYQDCNDERENLKRPVTIKDIEWEIHNLPINKSPW